MNFNRRFLLKTAFSTTVFAGLTACGGARIQNENRPNLVFVFSDQQSWDMLGCYGNEQVISPNLDRLASQGVRFEHCISSAPICTPYRGILLSGRHPLHNGAFENDVRMLSGDGNYFADVLKRGGYRVGYYGKWHLYGGDRNRPVPAGPFRYGFDQEFLVNNCTLVYDKERAYYWDEEGKQQLYGDWEPYAQTRQAIRFIENHHDKPFALFLSWHPPHNWLSDHEGYLAPSDCLKLYEPEKIKLRPNVEDTPASRRRYQGHMAMITSLDNAFGTLVKALEEKGIADNTIIVFTSDHGDALRSHGIMHNKMRPEQESIRVPLIIRYPKLLKPRTSELLVGSLDLMPTLLGMMNLPVPATCDGTDLSRYMADGRDDAVDSVPLFLSPLDFRGVYTRHYTYFFDTSGGTVSQYRELFFNNLAFLWNGLYDRQADPHETNNLYSVAQYSEIREQLHRKTLDWMNRFGDQGVPYQTLATKVFTPEDQEARNKRQWDTFTGVLRGRPMELLNVKMDTPHEENKTSDNHLNTRK